ncbi:MAG: hypothetical protein HC804_05775 [Anaerolineae bacterium]|nr:hypothetical protein [Anaerolineae bacterium]
MTKNDGLNVAALRGIEQAQRINRDLGEYKQSGLNEFHIGIIYLYWGECHAAEKGFDLAWRHWSMAHEQLADLALSLFGRGWAQEIFRHEEAAMISYAKSTALFEADAGDGGATEEFSGDVGAVLVGATGKAARKNASSVGGRCPGGRRNCPTRGRSRGEE